ncbi:MAG: hypothetical protein NVS9B15_02140 [Acidobacteriaceae bacterium]
MYACLYVDEFPTQALLRLRPELREKACEVMQGDPPLQSVCSANAKASEFGVVNGMTRVEVDTFASITVLARSCAEEESAKTALLGCAGAFSPRIEDQCRDGAFICVVDIAGTEKLFGSARMLAKALLLRVRALGLGARIAVSANFHAAMCMASGMPANQQVMVIAPGEESAALAPLPISTLDLTAERAATFADWGIQTLGMLAALPETSLISRLGQAGKRLRQMALGELPHLFIPLEPVFTLREHVELETPIELLDSLMFVIGVMIEQLMLRAAARMYALASVTVSLGIEGGASHVRSVLTAVPSTEKQLWVKLLHLDLTAHPPQASILSVSISAEPGATSKIQLGLFAPQSPDASRLDVTLARIRAIVGEDAVGSAVLTDTHQPDAFRMEPFRVRSVCVAGNLRQPTCTVMRRIRPTEKVSMMLRDGSPHTFCFRDRRYAVSRACGPWLADGEWWNGSRWSCAEWDVIAQSSEGAMLSCCLAEDQMLKQWHIVGLYD